MLVMLKHILWRFNIYNLLCVKLALLRLRMRMICRRPEEMNCKFIQANSFKNYRAFDANQWLVIKSVQNIIAVSMQVLEFETFTKSRENY